MPYRSPSPAPKAWWTPSILSMASSDAYHWISTDVQGYSERARASLATDIRAAIGCYDQLIQVVSTTQNAVQDQLPGAMDRLRAFPPRLYQHLFDIFAKWVSHHIKEVSCFLMMFAEISEKRSTRYRGPRPSSRRMDLLWPRFFSASTRACATCYYSKGALPFHENVGIIADLIC